MKIKNVIITLLMVAVFYVLIYDENNRYEYATENNAKVTLSDNATIHYTTTPILKNKEYYITY